MTINDYELTDAILKIQQAARGLSYLEREAQGYELMKALQRIDVAAQIAMKRLAELK